MAFKYLPISNIFTKTSSPQNSSQVFKSNLAKFSHVSLLPQNSEEMADWSSCLCGPLLLNVSLVLGENGPGFPTLLFWFLLALGEQTLLSAVSTQDRVGRATGVGDSNPGESELEPCRTIWDIAGGTGTCRCVSGLAVCLGALRLHVHVGDKVFF